MATKMTKKDYFQILRDTYPTDAENYAEVIAFIDHEVDLLSRKNSGEKKPTAQQKANSLIKEAILDQMEPDHGYTITDIQKSIPECADLSNQRITALMRQLKEETFVRREEVKGKAFYFKAI